MITIVFENHPSKTEIFQERKCGNEYERKKRMEI